MKVPLPVRLFATHAAVAAVGAVVAYLTVRLLLPRLFDQRMGRMDGMGPARGLGPANSGRARMHDILLPALDSALLIGLVASVLAAGAIALVVTRWLVRPLDAIRGATRRIAAGDYGGSVPLPAEPGLAALATDVNTLAHALADTESRRTRLLGEAAHEMRTPLTVLDGYVEGLIDGVFTADPDTLASLSEELRRLHRLTDDLYTLSRAQEQRLDLHVVDADLAALTRQAANRLAPQFEDAAITLTVTAEGPLPGNVDPDRITQVLTNLLGNALLATPAGGTVAITARQVRDRSEITVSDTGVGLTKDDTERVFERFYRVRGQPRRSAGSGVGLTIARGIAHAHGGDLTASSPGPGQGARFTLVLPLRSRPTTVTPG
jgi:histidine kinase